MRPNILMIKDSQNFSWQILKSVNLSETSQLIVKRITKDKGGAKDDFIN